MFIKNKRERERERERGVKSRTLFDALPRALKNAIAVALQSGKNLAFGQVCLKKSLLYGATLTWVTF
jgi:hypothetical protein